MTDPEEHIDYSIVICTYNPEPRTLKRCLQAVKMLDRNGLLTEVILVDNNSKSAVKAQPYVIEFEQEIPGMKIIVVKEQGVKYARMAAIRESRGRYIVYIDYDNEPEKDYLQQLKILNSDYPDVAAWGPGEVTVDFIDGVEKRLEDFARSSFQEKHLPEIAFDNKNEWQSFYPVGTGLCTFSSVLKDYVKDAGNGRFSLPGRKGNQLTSGEDTQMVLLAVSKGFFAGSSPTLKLKHLIPESRANTGYIRRLIFGTVSCYETCMLEVFPEKLSGIQNKLLDPVTFTRRAAREFIKCSLGVNTMLTFDLIYWLGSNAGVYYALGKPLPGFVQWLIKYLKAE